MLGFGFCREKAKKREKESLSLLSKKLSFTEREESQGGRIEKAKSKYLCLFSCLSKTENEYIYIYIHIFVHLILTTQN